MNCNENPGNAATCVKQPCCLNKSTKEKRTEMAIAWFSATKRSLNKGVSTK